MSANADPKMPPALLVRSNDFYLPDSAASALEVALRALADSGDNAEVRIGKHMTSAGWLFEVDFQQSGDAPKE